MDDDCISDSGALKFAFFALVGVILLLLAIATVFYHVEEGWSYVDSLYFASTSLSTRGFNNLVPTTPASKIFTATYLFLGVVLTLYALSVLIGYFVQYKQPTLRRKVNAFVQAVTPEFTNRTKWFMIKPRKK